MHERERFSFCKYVTCILLKCYPLVASLFLKLEIVSNLNQKIFGAYRFASKIVFSCSLFKQIVQ